MDLLSPNSPPSGVPPTTSSPPSPATTSPPPSPSTSSLPPPSQTNQTTEPPSSPPPPQSPPTSAPPSPPSSPPPSASFPSSPPPPLPESPPPPSTPTSPPPLSSISQSPPPPTSSLPSTLPSPPPLVSSSPPPPPSPPDSSPPPPSNDAPPSQSPPDTPPQNISPSSVPPPSNDTTPTSSNFPPPPSQKSPERSPPPPRRHSPPPPLSQPEPPPSASSPTSPLLPDTHPPSSPPSVSFTPTNSSSQSPTISSLPEKPTPETTPSSNVTPNGSSGDGKQSSGPVVAIAVVVGFMLLSFIVMGVWFVKRRKRRSKLKNINYTLPSPFNSSQNSDSSFLRSHSPAALVGSRSGRDFMHSSTKASGISNSRGFTYEDLVQATKFFSAKNILGEGGFGCVYKGTLPDGREVAVKQLKIGGGQGEREFRAEVEIISRVHHRHLVSLVGYCISEYQRLLVYDYVPNNSLHYHLHAHSALPLDWAMRVRIAAGAARGIAYLHEDCHPRIIHRDIKSSNILLDVNFEARVADFGLAKLALDSHTHVTTRVMGTFGYMAPEYATSGKLTDKSDVFSFGVVLLELITGRKPVDSSQPLGAESLVEWARPLLAQVLDDQNFEELVDPKLEKNYVASEIFRMIEAAAACVRHSAIKRPRMSQVVRALDCLDEMSDLANGVKPGQSGIIDSVEQSAQIRMFQRMAFGSRDFNTGYFDRDRSQSQGSWRSREYDDDLSSSAPFNRSELLNN